MNTVELDLKRLANLIKEIKIAMLITSNEDGSMHSRPMATQELNVENFDGTLWFFSKKNSQKNQSLENDQHVTLAYANPSKNHYISINGRATISNDRGLMKELWTPILKAWFPEGLMDPELSLIGVNIESAEIWDSPISKAEQMMGVVRSAITGKPYQNDKNSSHIDLAHRH